MASRADDGSSAPLIAHDAPSCAGCWGCVRHCPVSAIRVIDGHSEIIREKCVACGHCVTECGNGGFTVRDDVPRVEALLRAGRPVVVLLATEFVAALHPMTVSQIERALMAVGFSAIETSLLGEEIVALEYERLHTSDRRLVTIRSTCPVANDFVRKYYPGLVPALASIVPPYVAQARLVKLLHDPGTAVVYVSPCFARKDECADPQFGGAVDVAIDFLELRRMMDAAMARPAGRAARVPLARRPNVVKEISLTDGFPRGTLTGSDCTDETIRVVRGIAEIDALMRAISTGEAAPEIIDMLNCEGCIDGPAVRAGLSIFAKRNIESAARTGPGVTRVSTRAMLEVLPRVDTLRSFTPDPVAVPEASAAEIDRVLAEGGLTRATAPDCGACGWDTCVEHAAAICRADSSWDMCFPLQRSLLDASREALARCETLDPTTGRWNKRSFTDRLDLELARHARYGSPLSLVLADIDHLAAVNDRLGDAAGDAILAGAGERIAGSLRATDFVARFTGDQFAIILPGIGKTAAFAVAEKLRETLKSEPFVLDCGGYTEDVGVSMCAGVAAATPGQGVSGLVEAADSALHSAMSYGQDQVRLALG